MTLLQAALLWFSFALHCQRSVQLCFTASKSRNAMMQFGVKNNSESETSCNTNSKKSQVTGLPILATTGETE
jgi:hypothetical protein